MRRAASLRTRRSGGLSSHVPDLVEPGVGQRVRLRVARARARLLDQPFVEEARELGVDLAVTRRPGIRERLLEVLQERVAGAGLVGERSEECIAERHLNMSILTCKKR